MLVRFTTFVKAVARVSSKPSNEMQDIVQNVPVHGSTDDLGYAAIEKITTVHDLHATMLYQLGIDHKAFSFKFQGLDARLSGVEGAKVIKDILA